MKRKNSLLKGGKVDKYGCFSMKHIIMDSEGDGRALVPDDLEQHQSWGGTMPKEDRSGRWTDTAMNIYYLQLSSQSLVITVRIDQDLQEIWRMVISKVSIFQIAITSTIPFLPAISEDFVFDDLPAIAKNNDLVAASPAPIFWVCTASISDEHHISLFSTTSGDQTFPRQRVTNHTGLWQHFHFGFRCRLLILVITDCNFTVQTRGHKMPPALNLKMVNVFLHFCCSLIFFLLLQSRNPLGRLPGKNQKELALFSALIFASHPVHVEPVVTSLFNINLSSRC